MNSDVSALLSIIVQASTRSPEEFVEESLGSLMFLVFLYMDTFKQEPETLDDLVDGMLYIDSRNYMEERQHQRMRAESRLGGN